MGTPVWVNRYVAEADYRIGLGRVFPHTTHGYEGGYKLILPGVVGFDTILRDHSFNFASTSVPGVRDNPSRAETDNVGRMVGIDFLINVVVNHEALPCKAFAGAVEPVYATRRRVRRPRNLGCRRRPNGRHHPRRYWTWIAASGWLRR